MIDLNFPLFVFIAVAGEKTLLKETLVSLTKCNKPKNFKGVYIIENGIKYHAENIANQFRNELRTKYLYLQKGNKSAALNYGLNEIYQQSLIFMTDDDASFDNNVLIEYENASKKYGKEFFFGGRMEPIYEKKPEDILLPFLPTSSLPWPPYNGFPKNTKFLGINWAAFSEQLKKAGGFNEEYGPGTIPRRTGQEHKMQEDLLLIGVKPFFIESALVFHNVPIEKCSREFAMSRQKQYGLMLGLKNRHKLLKLMLIIFQYTFKSVYTFIFFLFTQSEYYELNFVSNYKILNGLILSLVKTEL